MARGDPAEKAMIRLEVRRFAARCDMQEGLIRRADTLREVSRLATIVLPYRVAGEYESRDAQQRVLRAAESRAREIIHGQVEAFHKMEREHRDRLKVKMTEDWANLTGPLGHLRTWAQGKLNMAEQAL